MDKRGVQAARERVEWAQDAEKRMLKAWDDKDVRAAKKAWHDFITLAGTVYSHLEQAVKGNGPATGWFGRAKNIRSTDPLLKFIHQARNCDQHGLEGGVIGVERRAVALDLPGWEDKEFFGFERPDGDYPDTPFFVRMTSVETGKQMPLRYLPPTKALSLAKVVNKRHGHTCDPPTRHLGEDIEGIEPLGVVTSGVVYLDRLVAEAEAFLESK